MAFPILTAVKTKWGKPQKIRSEEEETTKQSKRRNRTKKLLPAKNPQKWMRNIVGDHSKIAVFPKIVDIIHGSGYELAYFLLKMNDGLVLLVYYACVTCTDMIHYRLNQIDLYLND